MEKYICTTCGVQYLESAQPPEKCKICEEERQYVNPDGQTWTTLSDMRASGEFSNELLKEEGNLYSITTFPEFGIGQTAYLIKENGFNVLWDCITYLDDKTIEGIHELGGIDVIALSHPHYYSAMVEWADVFDAPIYIHEADKRWVVEPSSRIEFWSGEKQNLTGGIALHRLGGHFAGGAVLHWPNGDRSQGVLLTGDIIQVVADREWVSFMYSYPNLIPLPAGKVAEIAQRVNLLDFNRIYNAFHRIVEKNAHESVQRSAKRYIDALAGKLFTT